MSERVALVLLGTPGEGIPSWDLGPVASCEREPRALAGALSRVRGEGMAAVLCWDETLGRPPSKLVAELLRTPIDVWHSGLRLGAGGVPRLLDLVAPTWMLNRDPDPGIEATSWRLSLGCCLLRSEVIDRLGDVDPGFATLGGAGLDMGLRYLSRGALMRHVPSLVEAARAADPSFDITLADEFRVVANAYGRTWAAWAAWRSLRRDRYPIRSLAALPGALARPAATGPGELRSPTTNQGRDELELADWSRVSVLIPTLDRYAYLRRVLRQLAKQSIPPLEVIVVDQTEAGVRQDVGPETRDLPVTVIHQDRAGQSTARNAGLRIARGDYILFLDDDVEIPSDLIERHARVVESFGADASCGVAEEVGAGLLPEAFTRIGVSPVFPTNNTLLSRVALEDSGLFDLAFDTGARADHDLGMRLYLAGKLLILNPAARILHHRAPKGGLREHRARVITYAASRRKAWTRHLASPTELYLWMRYFTPEQVREARLIRIAGTLSTHSGLLGRIAGFLLGLLLLPHTLWRMRRAEREARALLAEYPQIPRLVEGTEREFQATGLPDEAAAGQL